MDVYRLCDDADCDLCGYLITRSEWSCWVCVSICVLYIDFNNEADCTVHSSIVILITTGDRDITLHTKMNYCTRCWFAIQTVTNTIYTLYYILKFFQEFTGVRVGIVGWRTTLHSERSRVQFAMGSCRFFIDLILLVTLWHWGGLSL